MQRLTEKLVEEKPCARADPHGAHIWTIDAIDGNYYRCPGCGDTEAIDEVKFFYDAASAKKGYVHIRTVGGERLVVEVERKFGHWVLSHRSAFTVRVD